MKPPLRVLVADDERLARHTTHRQLVDAGYVCEAVENAFQAMERIEAESWDVVITDLRMPNMTGLELLHEIRRREPTIDVVLVTAFGTVETAVDAMRQGAADFILKPFPFEELRLRLARLEELRNNRAELQRLRAVVSDHHQGPGILGRSAPMRQVYERIAMFAEHAAPVLVVGETGTGKEMVARALHESGPRASRRFVPVSCGTIPSNLAESELFGHERGSFTGATERHLGAFERANGGTLVLDDIDDLPGDIQVKFLRVLQDGRFPRVGGNTEIQVDVRVVATSKVPLEQAVSAGKFRADLFYRLRGLEIYLPKLRDRGEDFLILAQHFLATADGGNCQKTLSVEAVDRLRRWRWPGNVRELRRAMETAAVLCRGDEVRVEHLPDYLQRETEQAADGLFTLHLSGVSSLRFSDCVREFEDALIEWAMRLAGGQQLRAAELLNLPRTTLQSKLGRERGTTPTPTGPLPGQLKEMR